MTRDTLNDIAQERFQQLKRRFHLNEIATILPQAKRDQIRNEITMKDSLEDVIRNTEAQITYDPKIFDHERIEAEEKARFVNDSFNFIESLKLPPQLSLAIGLIISGHKTNNKQDIANAVAALGEYTNA